MNNKRCICPNLMYHYLAKANVKVGQHRGDLHRLGSDPDQLCAVQTGISSRYACRRDICISNEQLVLFLKLKRRFRVKL